MVDNVVYEKKCVRMRKNRIFTTTKKYKQTSHSPRFAPHPHPKILGTPLLCPCTQNENSTPLHLCVVSLCVYTVGFIL